MLKSLEKPDRKECYNRAAFKGRHKKYARYIYPFTKTLSKWSNETDLLKILESGI